MLEHGENMSSGFLLCGEDRADRASTPLCRLAPHVTGKCSAWTPLVGTAPGHGYSPSLLAERPQPSLLAERPQDRYNYRPLRSMAPVQCRCTHEARLRITYCPAPMVPPYAGMRGRWQQ
jgi:hypothetical protein